MNNNVAILAAVAAVAFAFEIQALVNLAPVIWKPVDDIQVGLLCTGVDLHTACALAGLTLESPKAP
jgi:hypothetical protein